MGIVGNMITQNNKTFSIEKRMDREANTCILTNTNGDKDICSETDKY